MKNSGYPAMSRKLGTGEKVIWLIDRVCSFKFVIHARVKGEFKDSDLRLALDAVQSRHPLLRARIARKGWANAYFEVGETAKIPLVIIQAGPQDWIDPAEAELRSILPWETGPLICCILIRHVADDSTVIINFHHSIGDAMSGVFLLRDLMLSLSEISETGCASLPPLELQKPIEGLFPDRVKGIRGILGNLAFTARFFSSLVRLGKPAVPKPDGWAPVKDRKIHIVSRTIDQNKLDALVKSSRANDTTVHGALAAAAMIAIAGDNKEEKFVPFLLGSDVDLRGYLSPQVGDDVGLYISGGLIFHQAGQNADFWRLAREARESLKKLIERDEHLTSFTRMLQIMDLNFRIFRAGDLASRIYAKYMDMTNPGLIALSNIGRVELPARYGKFALENFGFASSFSSSGCICIHTATFNNSLVMDISGMEPLLSREHTARIADLMIAVLEKNCSQQDAK
jgi:NRPS condensation-like uncharacterized protein